LSILNIPGNKTGNRRTANIRSDGYSDLFVLNKHDLWQVLQDYPQAMTNILENGKALLRKDGLLDEGISSAAAPVLAQPGCDDSATVNQIKELRTFYTRNYIYCKVCPH
jgi:hypothetical protein